jgi:hypothetical protein
MLAAADRSLRLAAAAPARVARLYRLLAVWLAIVAAGIGIYALTLTAPFAAGARVLLLVLAALLLVGAAGLFRLGATWSRDARRPARTGR